MYMKKAFLALVVLCAVAMMAGCKGGTANDAAVDSVLQGSNADVSHTGNGAQQPSSVTDDSGLQGTVWVHHWATDMDRDFVAFITDDKAFSYSYENDEYEFCEYHVYGDTLKMTTLTDAKTQEDERNLEHTDYYYKLDKDYIVLEKTVFSYDGNDTRVFIPTNEYKLHKRQL